MHYVTRQAELWLCPEQRNSQRSETLKLTISNWGLGDEGRTLEQKVMNGAVVNVTCRFVYPISSTEISDNKLKLVLFWYFSLLWALLPSVMSTWRFVDPDKPLIDKTDQTRICVAGWSQCTWTICRLWEILPEWIGGSRVLKGVNWSTYL